MKFVKIDPVVPEIIGAENWWQYIFILEHLKICWPYLWNRWFDWPQNVETFVGSHWTNVSSLIKIWYGRVKLDGWLVMKWPPRHHHRLRYKQNNSTVLGGIQCQAHLEGGRATVWLRLDSWRCWCPDYWWLLVEPQPSQWHGTDWHFLSYRPEAEL